MYMLYLCTFWPSILLLSGETWLLHQKQQRTASHEFVTIETSLTGCRPGDVFDRVSSLTSKFQNDWNGGYVQDVTRSKTTPGQRRFNCYKLMRHSLNHYEFTDLRSIRDLFYLTSCLNILCINIFLGKGNCISIYLYIAFKNDIRRCLCISISLFSVRHIKHFYENYLIPLIVICFGETVRSRPIQGNKL